MQRRTLLLSSASTLGLAAAGAAQAAAPTPDGQAPATTLAAQLVAGRLRSEDLVQDCLQRKIGRAHV